MNKLEQYLAKQDKIINDDREKTLISLGLVEKEYAPDNKENWKYTKYDYKDGEKRYYREVAIKVTDEEYALIMQKTKQVAEIRAKEEQERQKERSRASLNVVKQCMPVFRKPKSEWQTYGEEEKADNGRSGIATLLRIVAWTLFALACIGGIILALTEDMTWALVVLLACPIELLLFLAFASVLDHLAELTAIARNGYKYSETPK